MSTNQTIEELCSHFKLDQSIKSSVLNKFEMISKHNSFNFTSKHTKSILSAVCLYLTLSEDQKPLTITQICHKIDCNLNDFGRVYNLVLKDFSHLKNESVSIEGLVEVILKDVTLEDPEERQPLIKRIIELISIVRQCWLIEGRSPVHIIMGAAYLAWKSLNPSVRTKVKLTEFCNIVSVEYRHTTSKRVNEIFNALKKLGQKIPGKEKFRFNRQNIAIFIDDILDYSNSLLYDLSFDVNQKFRLISNNTGEETLNWINTFKQRSHSNRLQNQLMAEIPFDSNKRQNDEEISDSEINSYLRSDKEVKKIKKLKQFIENEEKHELNDKKLKEKGDITQFIDIDIKF